MSCPWAKISKPEPVNLTEIMSEELAKDLQAKEEEKFVETLVSKHSPETAACSSECLDIPQEILDAISAEDQDRCQSDAEIAKLLQMQFDKEHDEMLKKTENKFNGASKVSISFDNYRRVPQNFDFESDPEEEEIEDIRDRKDWDRFDNLQREIKSIPACGYKMNKDGTMTTKHDMTMNGRKNACKMLEFPPEFQTGDGENFDMKLSNKVYNSLKIHSRNEQARKHKLQDKKEDLATASFGLDQETSILLYKMINQHLLESIDGIISIGKEAVILHANSDPNSTEENLPKECAIKVFKTTLSEFKHRDKYIKDDHRFKDRIGNQTSKKTVHIWAEKEMSNLSRLMRAGIPCPDVVKLKKYCLVMSFIGENNIPACKLKDAVLSHADYIVAYDEIIDQMKSLYTKANLIHGDLSEYNILWHNNKCYFIDVSQSVEPDHESSFHFLMRDCNNITRFFTRKNIPQIMTAKELFKSITGCEFDDKVALLALRKSFTKPKPHLVDRPGFEDDENSFETVWEKIAHRCEQAVDDMAQQSTNSLPIVEPPLA